MIAWPAAGASTMIRSAAPRSLERLHLAEHEDVLHPRHRGRDDVERARCGRAASRCASCRGLEVVDERGVGGEGAGPEPGRELGFVVAERRRSRTSRAGPICPRPRRSARSCPCGRLRSASAAVTVVFPTPPLPATITTREVEQNCATSIAPHATGALIAPSTSRRRRVAVLPCGRRSCWRRPSSVVDGRPRGAGDAAAGTATGIDVVQVNGLHRPAERVAHARRRRATPNDDRTRRARLPARLAAPSTSNVERARARRSRTRRSRSRCGSGRPVPTRGAPPRCSPRAPVAFVAPGSGVGPAPTRCGSTIRDEPTGAAVTTRRSPRSPKRRAAQRRRRPSG